MENISIFLAKFWGWYCIIFFLSLSLNPKRIKQIFEDLKDQKFVILISFLAIIIGLLNILFHNIWVGDWRLLITIFGWSALFKGLFLFTFPSRAVNWVHIINIKFIQVLYISLFFIGVFLLNMAYGIVLY